MRSNEALPSSTWMQRRVFLGSAMAFIACHRERRKEAGPVETGPGPVQVSSAVALANPETSANASSRAASSADAYPLFDAFPRLARGVPRKVLGRFPTAIDPAKKLGAALAGTAGKSVELYLKRDDESGDLYGGGKVRKLELFFADALARGATSVITSGGVGSNQAVAVALYGAALGLEVRLLLAPQPPGPHVTRNLAMSAGAGARIERVSSVVEAEAIAARAASSDPRVYVIAPGGTTPLGTMAFVSAGLELASDVKKSGLAFDRIYAALGTGGSAVGLAIGTKLGGLDCRIVGVRASTPGTSSRARLDRIHRETVAFGRSLDPGFPDIGPHETGLEIDGLYLGKGYGVPTGQGARAGAMFERTQGSRLDPVYTEKTMAALVGDAPEGSTLFWLSQSTRPPSPFGPIPDELRAFSGRAAPP